MPDMFRIADIDFVATSARLKAGIDRNAFYDESMMIWEAEMVWSIEIEATTNVPEFSEWIPHISGTLFITSPHEFDVWQGLAPRSIDWIEPNDTDDVPSAVLYIFEHTPLFECNAECYIEDNQFRLRLSGRCDVYFDETYDEYLPIEIDLPLQFFGIWCGREPEEECRGDLAQFLNNEDFDYVETEHGVSLLKPR